MKKALIILGMSVLCVLSTGCNKNPEQPVICRATVIEKGDTTMIVAPLRGSSEISSSDKFSVGLTNWDILPQVGDTVEITYSGEILEIYPASFYDISDIKIISE